MSDGRYLVLVGDRAERARHSAAARGVGLHLCVDNEDFTLLADSTLRDTVRIGASTCLIGIVHAKPGLEGPQRISLETLDALEPAELLERWWGHYVLFRFGTSNVEVYRAPSGGLAAFIARSGSTRAVASDPDILVAAGVTNRRVDWDMCAWHLSHPVEPAIETALAGISEVLPGFQAAIRTFGQSVQPWWDPWAIAGQVIACEYDRAAADLARTIDACTAMEADGFDQLILRLSGGLDSSIVAASLPLAESTRFITLVPGSGDGDERLFARIVASHCGQGLDEIFYDTDQIDVRRPSYPELARPKGRLLSQAIDTICLKLAAGKGRVAVLTGYGGDNVFSFQRSIRPAIDRWRTEGASRGVLTTLAEICTLSDASISEAGKALWRHHRRGAVALTIPVDPLFLHPTRLVAETLASRHPWITSPHSDLPGKAAHVALVASALSQTSTPFRGRLPILDPLLSQPIVELSLRMPSWWWCRDGRDRSVARRAYESRLPAAIIGRVTKGGPDAFCRRLLEREAASVADLLLDGLLAKHQIIDRAAVEAVLGANHDHTPREDARLLQLCDAEAWARHWTGAGA